MVEKGTNVRAMCVEVRKSKSFAQIKVDTLPAVLLVLLADEHLSAGRYAAGAAGAATGAHGWAAGVSFKNTR